jgi:hypothetical protein
LISRKENTFCRPRMSSGRREAMGAIGARVID